MYHLRWLHYFQAKYELSLSFTFKFSTISKFKFVKISIASTFSKHSNSSFFFSFMYLTHQHGWSMFALDSFFCSWCDLVFPSQTMNRQTSFNISYCAIDTHTHTFAINNERWFSFVASCKFSPSTIVYQLSNSMPNWPVVR